MNPQTPSPVSTALRLYCNVDGYFQYFCFIIYEYILCSASYESVGMRFVSPAAVADGARCFLGWDDDRHNVKIIKYA